MHFPPMNMAFTNGVGAGSGNYLLPDDIRRITWISFTLYQREPVGRFTGFFQDINQMNMFANYTRKMTGTTSIG